MQIRGVARPVLISLNEDERSAEVRWQAETRTLRARRIYPAKLHVEGFLAEFRHGMKVWAATAVFTEIGPGQFSFEELLVHGFVPPGNGSPARIIGFAADCHQAQLGTPQGHWRYR